jgi:hypothetical protein
MQSGTLLGIDDTAVGGNVDECARRDVGDVMGEPADFGHCSP